MSNKRVILVGATGLVGGHCLRLLLSDPSIAQIVAVARSPLPKGLEAYSHLQWVQADFSQLGKVKEAFQGDTLVIAMGTTIKKAGSRREFERVDLHLPLAAATLARNQGVRHLLLVSAAGANARSPIFYNRVKGNLEDALELLGFESLTIARPSLLLGERSEKRPAEALFQRIVLPVLPLIPAFWRPIPAEIVAQKLLGALRNPRPGKQILYNRKLWNV